MPITKLKIRLYGDPCLRKKSLPIKEVGPAERILIDSMIEAMHEYKGIGLAAAQVGINQRILVADIGDGPIAVINPQIIKKTGSQTFEEGCLSVPNISVAIKRPRKIIVKYLDMNGHVVQAEYDDLMARVIMHEIDHLDGKLIVDYATPAELEKWDSQLHALANISKKKS